MSSPWCAAIGLFVAVVVAVPLAHAAPALPLASRATGTLADTFFAEGDNFRAITEYRRELHEGSSPHTAARAWLRIGVSYARAKRYATAARVLAGLEALEAPPKYFAHGQYQLLLVWLDAGLGYLANRQAELCLTTPALRETIGADRLVIAKAAGLYEQRQFREAVVALIDFEGRFPTSRLHDVARALRRHINAGKSLRTYSPVAAGVMSAVVPGLGQLYQGRTWDGVQALLLVGLLGGATVGLVRHELRQNRPNWLLPVAVGGVSALVYGANVYGAANGARISTLMRQSRAMDKARQTWRKALNVSIP